jgi:hypothetical protein
MRTATLIVSLLVALTRAGSAEEAAEDLSGIWVSEKAEAALVLHAEGDDGFVGHPTDFKGGAQVSWHLWRLGGPSYRFWIIAHGGRAAEKLAESEVTIRGGEMTLPVSDAKGKAGKTTFKRFYGPLPRSVAGVKVGFRAVRKGEPDPDQYVDLRLVETFTRVVSEAKRVCPDLKRVLVTATVGTKAYRSKHHARHRRSGLAIGAVNGVSIERCGQDLVEGSRRLKDGGDPAPPRERHGVAALALLLCALSDESIVEACSADLLAGGAAPVHAWYLDRIWRKLPRRLARTTWDERWPGILRSSRKGKGRLHLAIASRKLEVRLKDAWRERYDRK